MELLRIIGMILIVMSHADEWMGLSIEHRATAVKFIADWLHLGGQIGVGCFLLISGYFMVDKKFNIKRILMLMGEVWCYTSGIFVLYIATKLLVGLPIDIKLAIRLFIFSFFPILSSHYWFVTAYLILLCLSPFFNILIESMSKKAYQFLLVILVSIFFLLDGGIPIIFDGMSEGRLIPVIIMYFIAGYIKKYTNIEKNHFLKHIMIAAAGYLFLYMTFIIIRTAGNALNSEEIISYTYFWRPLNSPIILLINIELFLAFLQLKMDTNKYINRIARTTFGIYLIHSNIIVADTILPAVFPLYKVTNPLKFFVYSIGSVAIVYIICSLIDVFRQNTAEKLWAKLIDKKLNSIEDFLDKAIAYIYQRI